MNNRETAIRARDLITEQSESVELAVETIIGMIPTALESWAREIADDPALSQFLTTDLATTTVTVSSGIADLSSLITSSNILLDKFPKADLKESPLSTSPSARFVASFAQVAFTRRTAQLFPRVFLDGTKLHTSIGGETARDTTLYVSASYAPIAADGVPTKLHGYFVEYLAKYAVTLIEGLPKNG